MDEARCRGCGGRFLAGDGSTHPYLLASPGCWTAYGEVLAREYQDQALFTACHRLTVDAYALQHPGDAADPRAVRSVWLHFASLRAIFAQGRTFVEATKLMQQLAGRDVPPLPSAPRWAVTVAQVQAADRAGHAVASTEWARTAYAGWAPLLTDDLDRLVS